MSLSIVIIFFVILLLIAMRMRKTTSFEEYIVGDKKLGVWETVLSVRATGESGWLVLGLAGMGYVFGVHALWVALGEAFFEGISWIFLARKFKREADKLGSITVVDYIESKVGDNIGIIRIISSLIILFLITAYLAAQAVAMGKVFYSFFNTDATLGIVIGMAVILTYTMMTGYKGVCKTDLFQGMLMFVGVMVLPIICLILLMSGGINLASTPAPTPHYWSLMGPSGNTFTGWISALSFFAIGLGFLGVPHIYVRFISAKDAQVIKRGIPIAILFTLLGDSCAVLTGMFGRYIFPLLSDGELIVPQIAGSINPVGAGILAAVVLAAIMSTADSLLMLVSSSVVRDVYQKLLNRRVPHKRLISYARGVVLLLSIISIVSAIGDIRLVFWMVLFAWAGLGAAFCPLMIFCISGFKVTKYGAVAGILGGCMTAIAWSLFLKESTGVYEMIPGYVVAFMLLYFVSKFERKYENIS